MAPSAEAAAASAADDVLYAAARRSFGSMPFEVVVVRDGKVVAQASSAPGQVLVAQRAASISKALTAAAVFRMVEAGKLRLDSLVLPLLPSSVRQSARFSWSSLTVDELLTQKSGLPADRAAWFNGTFSSCREAAAITLAREPLAKSYEYSNTNFCLLSLVLEASAGLSYEQAMRKWVFVPLGLSSAQIDPQYVRLLGAGAWRISPRDLASFLCTIDAASPRTSFCKSGFFSRVSQFAMTYPSSYNYGRGVWRFPSGAWGHSGTLNSARNLMAVLPNGSVVVAMVQTNSVASGLDLYPAVQRLSTVV